jgi:hypothetical protein
MKTLRNPGPSDIEDVLEKQSASCPYLRRAGQISRYPIEGYCLASPEGGLRVVTVGEFRELCTTPDHACCELYLGHRERHSAEDDPA